MVILIQSTANAHAQIFGCIPFQCWHLAAGQIHLIILALMSLPWPKGDWAATMMVRLIREETTLWSHAEYQKKKGDPLVFFWFYKSHYADLDRLWQTNMEGHTSLTVEIVVPKDVWISKKCLGTSFGCYYDFSLSYMAKPDTFQTQGYTKINS